jgi:hypothetical protein
VQLQNGDKETCIVSNIGIYCSSDKVGTVYPVQYIFENSTVNISALCNSREDMACCWSECILTYLYAGDNIHYEIHQFVFIHLQRPTDDSHRFRCFIQWRSTAAVKDSEIAASRKPFAIGHMYISTFLFRITDTVTSQNADISFWDTL